MLKEILTARTRPSDKALYNIWARKISDGWTETTITGSLPLTFRAKGDTLTDYTVHGTVAGAGVETVNLYNWTMPLAASGRYLDVNGDRQISNSFGITDYIPVLGSTTYTLSGITGSIPACCFYDENDEFIEGVRYYNRHSITFTTPVNAKKMRFSANINTESEYYHAYTMLVPDSVAPESYIPFGYQIPLSITDGTNTEDYVLYIGDTQLGEDEYLDYAEQKVYKKTLEWSCQVTAPSNNRVRYSFKPTISNSSVAEGVSAAGMITLRGTVSELTKETEGASTIEAPTTYEQITTIGRNAVEEGNGTTARAFVVIRGKYYYSDTITYTYDYALANQPIIPQNTWNNIPTDPPVAFPAITAYQGENTLSSTETLGGVSVSGKIKEVTP